MQKIGLALGGGGAKGLAHIPILQVLDEFGIRPHCIAGTSIGAVIGVLYASGYSGDEIRAGIEQHTLADDEDLSDIVHRRQVLKWLEYIDINWGGSTLLKADSFLEDLTQLLHGTHFSDLKIPLQVVAADFWRREQVVLQSGELKQAIRASMALPGVFSPVVIGQQVLVDGGAVNPVPFDLLGDCDRVIAVNVMGTRTESEDLIPSLSEAVFNTFQIMQASILRHKLRDHPPDLLLSPEIVDVQMLEFHKARHIFAQADSACEQLRRWLIDRGMQPVPSTDAAANRAKLT